jgi:EAL domain-containing protein (putative c-di-GMP-specific phosphodiesterase class I)
MRGRQIKRFGAGEVIFSEGDVGDCAYLIERGRVLIFIEKDGAEVLLNILGAGEVFGEMALIDDSPRSASCRTMSDCQLIVVTKEQLLDRVRAADPVVRLLMQVLLDRLRLQNDRLRGIQSPLKTRGEDARALDKKAALECIDRENQIAAAIEADEFEPYYQPIYDLQSGELCGCESLIRWVTTEGIITPDSFMDIMEDTSLILTAGRKMIEKTLRDLPAMTTHFSIPDFFVSVNVSGRQFTNLDFIEEIEESRARYGLSPKHIKLELTERIMTEGVQAIETLKNCRKAGYRLAIDDFGIGFSSMQYLANMPLTDLKIDRSFVIKMIDDKKSLSIIRSIIHLANLLGLNLIAEGIQTQAQLDLLRSLNVNMAQGFIFSQAVPLAEFLKLPAKSPLP